MRIGFLPTLLTLLLVFALSVVVVYAEPAKVDRQGADDVFDNQGRSGVVTDTPATPTLSEQACRDALPPVRSPCNASKRHRSTVFVPALPCTTVKQLKEQVLAALGPDVVPGGQVANIRLGITSTTGAGGPGPVVQWLDNDKATADQLKLANCQILFISLKTPEGNWEPIDIPEPEPMDEDLEE
ncbi:hypothetical protein IWQ60_011256 [Tieghemiomyces parasiticus]|uniref:Uncharacterized protein n=1 Tax=Tieghemiomyces parasiticus TaxID=78921 RepID=A0A9W8DLV3_9FUNG|nr:hypothetical protein IWQ60_011256 [Tieghemiomyces parasiticus]